MTNLLTSVVFLVVIGFLAWLGWGLEPHWSAKDGRRFMCRMQLHQDDERERMRWTDVKVSVQERELLVLARSRRNRSLQGTWRVVGANDDSERRRRIYELRNANDLGASLRVPTTSRCVSVLDALVP